MRTTVPNYFDQFHCLAGACPDTCCGQWEIVVDEQAKEKYLSVEGDLGQQLRRAITTTEGETRMVLNKGRCPMLTKDGLCTILLQEREDLLPGTCHNHPRFTEVYGGLQETALSVSCPEAARLLLEQEEPVTFLTTADDALPEPNDLDPELFFLMTESRSTAFSIVQNRSRPLTDRLALLLLFADRLENNLDFPAVCHRLCQLYTEPAYQARELRRCRRGRLGGSNALLLTPLRQLLSSMEHLDDGFAPLVQRLSLVKPDGVPLEQLAVYYIFRWWLKAACNGYLWRQAAAVVVSLLTAAGLAEELGDLQLAVRLYAKEVEHSEENMDLLRRAMELPYFSRPRLLRLLEV